MEAPSDEMLEIECDSAGAAERIGRGARLIDVRTSHEFDAGRIPGAERIGLEELPERRGELDAGTPVVFYCRIGNRSLMAAQAFAEVGFETVSLRGGIEAWLEGGHEIDPDGGFVAEPGEAAAILEAQSRAASK